MLQTAPSQPKNSCLLDVQIASLGIREDLLAGAQLITVDPAGCDINPLNTRDREACADHIERLRHNFMQRGQLEPAVGVPGKTRDSVVLLKGSCRAAAIRGMKVAGRAVQMSMLLLLINETQAQRIISAEQTTTKSWSARELALHFDKLLERYSSNKKIASVVGGDAANIGRACLVPRS